MEDYDLIAHHKQLTRYGSCAVIPMVMNSDPLLNELDYLML